MSWEIVLRTAAAEEAVSGAFEFVQHISDIKITCETAPAPAAFEPAAAAFDAMPHKKAPEEQAHKASNTPSIRVDLDKVDRLVNMVGELVITEAMLRARTANSPSATGAAMPGWCAASTRLSQHTRELQEAVMSVRMQPVKSIFSRMPRIVRDLSAQLGKNIQLVLSGENTEVDKTVIEQLGDPLTHMIRNSCDHGIETPDQRVWNDKPAPGTIHLSADHRGGRIIIEI